MKLLFDQNPPPRLVELLSDSYPNSIHVSLVGLDRALDEALWAYALENGYTIVIKTRISMNRARLAVIHPKWSGYVWEPRYS